MHIGIIGSGWLAQATARAWQAKDQVLLTTRDPDKQTQLNSQGFNCHLHQLGERPTFLSGINHLILATTCKELIAHQKLLAHLNQYPALSVLFVSSTSVYPNDGNAHCEDSDQILTDHPLYAIEQCLLQHPGTSVIRCGGLIGPGRHPGRFFQNKSIPSPDAPVNLLPLTDAVGVLRHMIEHDTRGTIVNACHNEHPKKGDYYPQMAQAIGLDPPACDPKNTSPGKIVNPNRLIDELGYQYRGNLWHIDDP